MQLLELSYYKDERKRLKDLYDKLDERRITPKEAVVVGGTAAKIYDLGDLKGFVKSILPPSLDVDVLLKPKGEISRKISDLKTSFPIAEVNYRSTEVKITYLPVENYKLGEDADVFIGRVGVIPADSKAYTSGGSITIDGHIVNAAYKPYAVASWLNPLAATDGRIKRSVIVLVPEVVEYGKEKLKAEVTEMLYYVARGSSVVDLKKEELESKDPNNSILYLKDFRYYDENFIKIARSIRASSEKLVRISTNSGQPEKEAGQAVETLASEIENNYDKILKEVKRR